MKPFVTITFQADLRLLNRCSLHHTAPILSGCRYSPRPQGTVVKCYISEKSGYIKKNCMTKFMNKKNNNVYCSNSPDESSCYPDNGNNDYSAELVVQAFRSLLSYNTVRSNCIHIYEDEMTKLLNILEKANGRISLTFDMWTSSCQKCGYLRLTAHYIDNSWEIKNKVFNFVTVETRHT
ncbi:hypothetical protein EJ110_NYTH38680 [Nymphaea thermarum]|nr:hypothetical protein EJ110_NYTH38680 [Nymphaea thermarum]